MNCLSVIGLIVRVALVSRNRPEVLRETLVCLGDRGLLEHVVVLDGSDGSETGELCEEFGVEHHFQDSSGMTAARNEP
jgi:glycosyltransferase involved in cell wall biosynthesis